MGALDLPKLVSDFVDQLSGVSGLEPLVRAVLDERSRRISVALATAEEMTGRTREDLIIWARETPQTLSLTIRVLVAAGSSGNDDTLRVLGGLLAEAMDHPERSSEQEVIVSALEGLTREQLIVLQSVSPDVPGELGGVAQVVAGRVTPQLIEPILVGLFSRGLMEGPYGSFGGVTTWQLSPFGRAIIDAAARVELMRPSAPRRPAQR